MACTTVIVFFKGKFFLIISKIITKINRNKDWWYHIHNPKSSRVTNLKNNPILTRDPNPRLAKNQPKIHPLRLAHTYRGQGYYRYCRSGRFLCILLSFHWICQAEFRQRDCISKCILNLFLWSADQPDRVSQAVYVHRVSLLENLGFWWPVIVFGNYFLLY